LFFFHLKLTKNVDRGFYQRLKDVINELKKHGFLFKEKEISDCINTLLEAFQIRHIAIHNMGYVDNDFVKKFPNKGKLLNKKYKVTQEFYKQAFNSYWTLLEYIDDNFN
jgi:nitrate reductase assembly molybdenum cofactor insertion protein NarJ